MCKVSSHQCIDTDDPSAHHSHPAQQHWPTFLVDREPAECFGARLNQNIGSTFSVILVAIPIPRETDDLGPHDMGSVHPSSTCPFAPFAGDKSVFLLCRRMMCVAHSAVRCRRRTSAPLISQKVLSVRHCALPCFQLCIVFDLVHNRFTVTFDLSKVSLCPAPQCCKFQGGQLLWFLCPPCPVGFGFLLHGLFHGLK